MNVGKTTFVTLMRRKLKQIMLKCLFSMIQTVKKIHSAISRHPVKFRSLFLTFFVTLLLIKNSYLKMKIHKNLIVNM